MKPPESPEIRIDTAHTTAEAAAGAHHRPPAQCGRHRSRLGIYSLTPPHDSTGADFDSGLMCDQGIWQRSARRCASGTSAFVLSSMARVDSLAGMAPDFWRSSPDRLRFVGHSMGGRVALEMARLAGARLRGLALLDTGFRPLAPGEIGAREVEGRMRLLEQAAASGSGRWRATWVQGMVQSGSPARPGRDRDYLEMFRRRSLGAICRHRFKALIEPAGRQRRADG